MLTNSILRDPLPFPDNVSDLVSANCVDVLSKVTNHGGKRSVFYAVSPK